VPFGRDVQKLNVLSDLQNFPLELIVPVRPENKFHRTALGLSRNEENTGIAVEVEDKLVRRTVIQPFRGGRRSSSQPVPCVPFEFIRVIVALVRFPCVVEIVDFMCIDGAIYNFGMFIIEAVHFPVYRAPAGQIPPEADKTGVFLDLDPLCVVRQRQGDLQILIEKGMDGDLDIGLSTNPDTGMMALSAKAPTCGEGTVCAVAATRNAHNCAAHSAVMVFFMDNPVDLGVISL